MNTRSTVLCLAALALAARATAQAEPLFAPPIYPSVFNIRGAAPGDVNEDGYPDLAVWANGPAIMLNQAGAGFAPPVAVGVSYVSIHLADLDEDGHLDLVGINAFDDVIRVALGNGDGTFAGVTDIPSAADISDVAIADLDGDGHLDLAAPAKHTPRVAIHLGHGDGTFEPKVDYGPIGDFAQAITAADLTADGVLDLAVASGNDDQVSLLYGNGDGTFTAAEPLLLPSSVEDAGAIDLDDDGDKDLVVLMGGSELRVVLNLGRGAFAHSSFLFPLPSSVNSRLVVRDFDEDGRDDVAIGIGAADMITVYRSTGEAGAGALELEGTYLGGRNPQGLSCADVDLDGDLDLIASNFSGNDVRVLRGEGDGSFRTGAGSWGSGADTQGIATGDFDEDGRLDLVTCGTGVGLSVTLNAGNGHFPSSTAWPVQTQTRTDVMVADFNGDGHADAATVNAGFPSTGATIVLGDGDGHALTNKTYVSPFGGSWTWIDAADFDLDGDLDVALGPGGFNGQHVVQVAFNDGDGDLSTGPLLDTLNFGGVQGVCTGDFNEDGKPDIAAVHGGFPGHVAVFLGNGAGAFSGPVDSASSGDERDVAAADLDGDGHLDLASASYNNQVSFHPGNGDGTFGPAVTYAVLSNPNGIVIGDLDHDGLLDLATANNHQFGAFASVSVLIGNGDGSFQPAIQFRTGAGLWHLALGDFDGDGWNDLAAAPEAGLDVLLNRRGPWNELGHGLVGTQGIPRQIGTGTMVPGQPFKFTLRDGRPFTTAYHVVGLAPLLHAFKGGVMVPSIDFINIFPVTNAQGTVVLQGPWVNVPSGLTLYFQFWLPDPQGPVNFAASTALSATMP